MWKKKDRFVGYCFKYKGEITCGFQCTEEEDKASPALTLVNWLQEDIRMWGVVKSSKG